jgi:hypothetical protein
MKTGTTKTSKTSKNPELLSDSSEAWTLPAILTGAALMILQAFQVWRYGCEGFPFTSPCTKC